MNTKFLQISPATSFQPLTILGTADAAALLNRKAQTLRKWACFENGPIRPIRINGRLAWRLSDIQALIEV